MDLRWRQQWRIYRILYAKTINSEKLPNELTFIFHSCQIYFWQEFLIFIKLVKIRNLLWKLKIFFYLCVNQVQHRVKRCKSAVGYSVYLKWGQSIKDWYTTEYGKGSFSSLSARTGDGLQIEFATRLVFSPELCVRRFESCQAVRPLKTSPRTRVHPGRFRGAWAAEWSCFVCTNLRTEVVSAVLGPMGEEIAGPVSDTLRHDLLLKLNILL